MVSYVSRQTINDKILLYNTKSFNLKTLYFSKEEVRKHIVNELGNKSDNYKTDAWYAFENKQKSIIYF